MKTILLIIIGLLIIGSYACKDSLGYDPKVIISKINNDTSSHITPPTGKQYTIDSCVLVFLEHITGDNYHPDFNVSWVYKINKDSTTIDTSGTIFKLWVTMDLSNTTQDSFYQRPDIKRFNWVDNIKMSFVFPDLNIDHIWPIQSIRLTDPPDKGNWVTLKIKYNDKHIEQKNGKECYDAYVSLFNVDKVRGYIVLTLYINLYDDDHMMTPHSVNYFMGADTIYYKKK